MTTSSSVVLIGMCEAQQDSLDVSWMSLVELCTVSRTLSCAVSPTHTHTHSSPTSQTHCKSHHHALSYTRPPCEQEIARSSGHLVLDALSRCSAGLY